MIPPEGGAGAAGGIHLAVSANAVGQVLNLSTCLKLIPNGAHASDGVVRHGRRLRG